MQPGMEIFFRRLGEAFTVGHLPAHVHRGGRSAGRGDDRVRVRRHLLLYNSAFDRGWGNLAPGMVLVGENIRLAIEQAARLSTC